MLQQRILEHADLADMLHYLSIVTIMLLYTRITMGHSGTLGKKIKEADP